jgi:hypothetical protein
MALCKVIALALLGVASQAMKIALFSDPHLYPFYDPTLDEKSFC